MFKLFSFDDYVLESQAGYKSAKKKKMDAARRASDMENRNAKNQAKYNLYDEKMKYEVEHTQLQNAIKAENDPERKAALRKQMKALKKEWKEEQSKLKARVKAI